MDGLSLVHKKGVTHRDLKIENILLDGDFNLKIADFGFAAPLSGRDESGSCRTRCGTIGNMAPEILLAKPYNGVAVDLFASAVVLFMMVTSRKPFKVAEPKDVMYRFICANRDDLFWKEHLRMTTQDETMHKISSEFRSLFSSMMQLDPTHRLSLAEI